MMSEQDLHKLSEFLLHDKAAVSFVVTAREIAHAWDDVVDCDKPIDAGTTSKALFLALVSLPRNPFYAANFDVLNPIVMSAILSWVGATRMERQAWAIDDDHRLHVAHIARAGYVQLVLAAAAIVGGYDHAAAISTSVLAWGHSETFDEYKAELAREAVARNKE